jgi:crotonobetainyl-CoA:carnitine CoA-transferase CaiB-like acyl-CoA transferase
MPDGPLRGVRVLDFTHVWAGPLCSRTLGDLGAEVIKVEAAWARGTATPPAASPLTSGASNPNDDHWNRQGVTNKLNRNKLGICVDSKRDEGRDVLMQLVRECDVVVENFSARAMKSMGLDWSVLSAINPAIIYVAMPGFGHSGPYKDYVAYGTVVEPMCGLTSFMGYGPDEPRVTATAVPDPSAGMAAATAIVTALSRRDRDGKGRYVELSLQEAAIALFGEYFLLEQMGETPQPSGNTHPDYSPCGVYPASGQDDWLAISVRDDDEWRRLAAVLGPAAQDDGRFSDRDGRARHHDVIDEHISAWTRVRDKASAMAELQAVGVAAGAVNRTSDLLADPQNCARDYFVELHAPHMNSMQYAGLPVRINGKRAEGWHAAPRLGEHNREVLTGLLGMDDAEVDALYDAGVLTEHPPG